MSQAQQTLSLDELRQQVNRMLDRLSPETSIAATVVFVVRSDKEETFVADIEALTTATRKLPGLNLFTWHQHQPINPPAGPHNPRYLIYEEWQTVAYFRTQWNSEHLKHFQSIVFGLLAGAPDLQFYLGNPQDQIKPGVRVLATGQKTCWDAEGNEVAPAGSGCDGEYRMGLPFPEPRYTNNGDGTVTDNRTGLIWLEDANRFGEVPWENALKLANELRAGTGGLADDSVPGDWRLPNINELQSLMDLSSTHGPALPDNAPFKNLHASNYWSSSTVSSAPALGWYTALAVAPPVFDLKMNAMRMWPVKGDGFGKIAATGQTRCYDVWGNIIDGVGSGQDGELRKGVPLPDPRFKNNGDGTVTDLLTGLIWLKNANSFGIRSWEQAIADCQGLCSGIADLADGSRPGDWRLPNLNELRSLCDYDHYNPALTPGNPFQGVRPSLYWSSTTVASAPNQSRFVFIGIGPSVWDHKSVQIGVWPVRGGH